MRPKLFICGDVETIDHACPIMGGIRVELPAEPKDADQKCPMCGQRV